MNTHSAVIAATRECFLRLGAAQVFVGDGPAMDRDTEAIIESVRLREYLGPLGNTFVDLNVDDVERIRLQTHASGLGSCTCQDSPGSGPPGIDAQVKDSPLGRVTLSLKNMFGIVPGSCYGWRRTYCTGLVSTGPSWTSTLRQDQISRSWTVSWNGRQWPGPRNTKRQWSAGFW